jgi:cold shock protein
MDSLLTTGVVKFYNRKNGFGFITDDGTGRDVFVGAINLAKSGLHGLEQGARVSFVTFRSRRGGLEATETPGREPAPAEPELVDTSWLQPPVHRGVVRFFSNDFGFIVSAEAGPDVFICQQVLTWAGIASLQKGQRVEYSKRQGPRGPQATSVR